MRGRPTPSGGGVPPNAQQGPRPASARSPAPSGSAALRFLRFLRGGRRPVSAGLGVALVATRVAWRAAAVGPQWPRSAPSAGGVGPAAAATQVLAGSSSPAGRCGDAPAGGLFVFTGPVRCAVSRVTPPLSSPGGRSPWAGVQMPPSRRLWLGVCVLGPLEPGRSRLGRGHAARPPPLLVSLAGLAAGRPEQGVQGTRGRAPQPEPQHPRLPLEVL